MRLPREILSYDEIRSRAEKFLVDSGRDKKFPIDIDRIVEIDLKIEVVPTPYLHEKCEVDAFILPDCSAIYIELSCWMPATKRGRFSLAHEAAHAILHRDALGTLKGKWSNADGYATYKHVQSQIEPEDLGWIEWQAMAFAGVLLVPSQPLKERMDIERAKYANSKLPPEIISGLILHDVADYFFVSREVIRRRCEYEKLEI